jgi:hypothetical protein
LEKISFKTSKIIGRVGEGILICVFKIPRRRYLLRLPEQSGELGRES